MSVARPARSPFAGPFTIEEYYELPEDGMRYELYDGALHVTPPPGVGHALVLSRLQMLIAHLPTDLIALQNVGVRLGASRVLVPDLLVCSEARALSPARDLGPSDVVLLAEAESPSSAGMDRTAKPVMYAEAGIPTYLRIVPSGPVVHLYVLVHGTYRMTSFGPGEPVTLPAPISVTFDPAQLAGSAE